MTVLTRREWHKLTIGGLLGALVPNIASAQETSQSDDFRKLVDEAWQVINTRYIDDTFNGNDWPAVREKYLARQYEARSTAYAAIREMLKLLNDPATRFLTAGQYAAFVAEVGGKAHSGLGLMELLSVDLDDRTRKLVVVTPLPNTPASRAGLKPHDVIESIGPTPTDGLGLAESMDLLRGPAGSMVELTVRRDNKRLPLRLKREAIAAPVAIVKTSVEQVQGRLVGYVALNQFLADSAQSMKAAIDGLTGKGIEGLILDLRGNPGGSLSACGEIAGIFIGEHSLANLIGRGGSTRQLQSNGAKTFDWPLMVIVNEGTASAAELLSNGLRSNNRAKIIGRPTFGKGLVHSLQTLSDNSAILVTVSRIQTLEGRDILNQGILPDVEVYDTRGGDAQLAGARAMLLDQLAKNRPVGK